MQTKYRYTRRWRRHFSKEFIEAESNLIIKPGETLEFEIEIDYEFISGDYKLSGEILSDPPIELNEVKFVVN